MAKRKPKRGKTHSKSRRLSLKCGVALGVVVVLLGWAGEWFVHHPRTWVRETCQQWPTFVTDTLLAFGNPVADLTDGLGWTGYDTVYEYDTPAPAGAVSFAGYPRRTGDPAPNDIRVISRGEFVIGWSDTLRHPVWCAYHVTPKARYAVGTRPSFTVDADNPLVPKPGAYKGSGFDRGHMVPNYAIVTRYGEAAQKLTFRMSNIVPQQAPLNRGVWREVEHRIADLWTARYGEIWVVVGAISNTQAHNRVGTTDIDAPTHYYQIILAQEGMDVRALALLFENDTPWGAWPARHIVSIDELERLSGLDFNPELPSFIAEPLEAELPNRLWPVKPIDVFRQFTIRYATH